MHITLPSSLRHWGHAKPRRHLRHPHRPPDKPGWIARLRAAAARAPWERSKFAEPEHHEDPRHVPKPMLWVPIVVPLVALTMLLLAALILSQA
jgi:hypothetical protein